MKDLNHLEATGSHIAEIVTPASEDALSKEEWMTKNPDGSVSFDAYAKMPRDELKRRCRTLSRALGNWQMIALVLYDRGKDGLSPEDREKLERLIEAYSDEEYGEASAESGDRSHGDASSVAR